MNKSFMLVAACSALLALAGCASTSTPYQPLQKDGGGYSETQIETNRTRLSFKGNSLTSRETVETYLLFRAAELTLANGFDYFSVVDRATDASTRTYGDYFGDPYFNHFSLRYSRFDPFGHYWDRPFYGSRFDTTTVTRFEASAEIAMFKGTKPADKPEAFDARDVVKNLSGKVVRPVPKP